MGHMLKLKLMVLITFTDIIQLVRFTEQRPQTSEDFAYFSIIDSLDTGYSRYDENKDSSEEYSLQNERDISSGGGVKASHVGVVSNSDEADVLSIHKYGRFGLRSKRDTAEDISRIGQNDFKQLEDNPRNSISLRKRINRSPISNEINEDNRFVYDESLRHNYINGDEQFPRPVYILRRSVDEDPIKNTANLLTNLTKSVTDIKSLITPNTTTHNLPIDDALTMIKLKRSVGEGDEHYGTEQDNGNLEETVLVIAKEKVTDLDVAESNLIFRPLFRYRSQIGERRRVYSNNYNNNN